MARSRRASIGRKETREVAQWAEFFRCRAMNHYRLWASAAVRRAVAFISVMELLPVSALAKFAPVMPIVRRETFFAQRLASNHCQLLRGRGKR